MGRVLAARGPDDERFFREPMLRLVFRRLAINDAERGAQPFSVDDGNIVTVVNGEIFNHREIARQELPGVPLHSHSDGEVVGHLYRKLGRAFLPLLNGIFAIAIWDRLRGTLLLARDRLGVKPLYVAQWPDGEVVFASELKALLQHPRAPRTPDWSAFGAAPDSPCPFERPAGRLVATGVEGVSFVPPACSMEWHDGTLSSPARYWQASGPSEADASAPLPTPGACVERYAALIDDSVRRQLLGDGPIGVFLSGGLDSCLIAALAARHGTQLEAFTLVEPSIAATGDTDVAVQLARSLGLSLDAVRVDQAALRQGVRLDLDALEHLVWSLDFPMFSVEMLFKYELHRHLRLCRPATKVVLLGQGADEFAGGYSALASSSWQAYAEHEAREFRRARAAQREVAGLLRELIDPARARLRAVDDAVRPAPMACLPPCEPWQEMRFGDLPAYNLWHEDRIAAAHGTEARVPFLDHLLVEWLCALPARARPMLFFDKAIERLAALGVLGEEIAFRPKVPLYAPGRDASIRALGRRLALDAFPAFRSRYLERPDAVFAKAALDRLRDAAADEHAPDPSQRASQWLLRCMAIASFERLCRESGTPKFEWPRWPALAAPVTARARDRTEATATGAALP